jgi:uncharacterized protein YndB with AHSA1/START domain
MDVRTREQGSGIERGRNGSATAVRPADEEREIVVERVVDAPRELVFEAFTDPTHVSSWWGPNGFTTTTRSADVRPGGAWSFVMHGPDGTDYENHVVYEEVERPALLRYAHGVGPGLPPEFHTTVAFEPVGRRTRVVLRARFVSVEARRRAVDERGAVEGGRQTLARLADLLERGTGLFVVGGREMVMSRVFRAPLEEVWRAHTEADRIPRWWGQRRLTTTVERLDVRPGGGWRFVQRDGAGHEYGFHGEYREVVPLQRLVATFEFDGMPGHVMVDTYAFEAVEGGTRLTARSRLETDSPEALDEMLRSGMEAGAIETWERLAELVEAD